MADSTTPRHEKRHLSTHELTNLVKASSFREFDVITPKNVSCHVCTKAFSKVPHATQRPPMFRSLTELSEHLSTVHRITTRNSEQYVQYKCFLCGAAKLSPVAMAQHVDDEHDTIVDVETVRRVLSVSDVETCQRKASSQPQPPTQPRDVSSARTTASFDGSERRSVKARRIPEARPMQKAASTTAASTTAVAAAGPSKTSAQLQLPSWLRDEIEHEDREWAEHHQAPPTDTKPASRDRKPEKRAPEASDSERSSRSASQSSVVVEKLKPGLSRISYLCNTSIHDERMLLNYLERSGLEDYDVIIRNRKLSVGGSKGADDVEFLCPIVSCFSGRRNGFASIEHVTNHLKQTHPKFAISKHSFKCFVCTEFCTTHTLLLRHLLDKHSININPELVSNFLIVSQPWYYQSRRSTSNVHSDAGSKYSRKKTWSRSRSRSRGRRRSYSRSPVRRRSYSRSPVRRRRRSRSRSRSDSRKPVDSKLMPFAAAAQRYRRSRSRSSERHRARTPPTHASSRSRGGRDVIELKVGEKQPSKEEVMSAMQRVGHEYDTFKKERFDQPLPCTQCWQRFAGLKLLKAHANAVHQSFDSNFRCCRCKYSSMRAGQMVVHLRHQHKWVVTSSLVTLLLSCTDLVELAKKRKPPASNYLDFSADPEESVKKEREEKRGKRKTRQDLIKCVTNTKNVDYDILLPASVVMQCPLCPTHSTRTYMGPEQMVELRTHLKKEHNVSYTGYICFCSYYHRSQPSQTASDDPLVDLQKHLQRQHNALWEIDDIEHCLAVTSRSKLKIKTPSTNMAALSRHVVAPAKPLMRINTRKELLAAISAGKGSQKNYDVMRYPTIVPCNSCPQKWFDRYEDFFDHLQRRHGTTTMKAYRCYECGERQQGENFFAFHMQNAHDVVIAVHLLKLCSVSVIDTCKTISDKPEMMAALKASSVTGFDVTDPSLRYKLHKCPICPSSVFKGMVLLKDHLTIRHGEEGKGHIKEIYRCFMCSFETELANDVVKHLSGKHLVVVSRALAATELLCTDVNVLLKSRSKERDERALTEEEREWLKKPTDPLNFSQAGRHFDESFYADDVSKFEELLKPERQRLASSDVYDCHRSHDDMFKRKMDCPYCKKQKVGLKGLKDHVRSVHGAAITSFYKCHLCHLKCGYPVFMHEHLKTVHDVYVVMPLIRSLQVSDCEIQLRQQRQDEELAELQHFAAAETQLQQNFEQQAAAQVYTDADWQLAKQLDADLCDAVKHIRKQVDAENDVMSSNGDVKQMLVKFFDATGELLGKSDFKATASNPLPEPKVRCYEQLQVELEVMSAVKLQGALTSLKQKIEERKQEQTTESGKEEETAGDNKEKTATSDDVSTEDAADEKMESDEKGEISDKKQEEGGAKISSSNEGVDAAETPEARSAEESLLEYLNSLHTALVKFSQRLNDIVTSGSSKLEQVEEKVARMRTEHEKQKQDAARADETQSSQEAEKQQGKASSIC